MSPVVLIASGVLSVAAFAAFYCCWSVRKKQRRRKELAPFVAERVKGPHHAVVMVHARDGSDDIDKAKARRGHGAAPPGAHDAPQMRGAPGPSVRRHGVEAKPQRTNTPDIGRGRDGGDGEDGKDRDQERRGARPREAPGRRGSLERPGLGRARGPSTTADEDARKGSTDAKMKMMEMLLRKQQISPKKKKKKKKKKKGRDKAAVRRKESRWDSVRGRLTDLIGTDVKDDDDATPWQRARRALGRLSVMNVLSSLSEDSKKGMIPPPSPPRTPGSPRLTRDELDPDWIRNEAQRIKLEHAHEKDQLIRAQEASRLKQQERLMRRLSLSTSRRRRGTIQGSSLSLATVGEHSPGFESEITQEALRLKMEHEREMHQFHMAHEAGRRAHEENVRRQIEKRREQMASRRAPRKKPKKPRFRMFTSRRASTTERSMDDMLRDRRRSYARQALTVDTDTSGLRDNPRMFRPQSSPNVKRNQAMSRHVLDVGDSDDDDNTSPTPSGSRRRARHRIRASTSDPTVLGGGGSQNLTTDNLQDFLRTLASGPTSSMTRHESWSEERSESRRQRESSFDLEAGGGMRRRSSTQQIHSDPQSLNRSLSRHASWAPPPRDRRQTLGGWDGVAAEEMMVPRIAVTGQNRQRRPSRDGVLLSLNEGRRPSLSDVRRDSTVRAVTSDPSRLEARRPSIGDQRRGSTVRAVTSDPLEARRPSAQDMGNLRLPTLADGGGGGGAGLTKAQQFKERMRKKKEAAARAQAEADAAAQRLDARRPSRQHRRPSRDGTVGMSHSRADALLSFTEGRRPSLSDVGRDSTVRAVTSDPSRLEARRPSIGDGRRRSTAQAINSDPTARAKAEAEADATAQQGSRLDTRRPSIGDGRRRSTARAINSDP